jgi:gluconate 2-dehydrogenase gamma chain
MRGEDQAMKATTKMRRRKFLKAALAAAAAAPMVSCTRSTSPWRFFTAEEAGTLEAVCERIVPADQDSGAFAAGVMNFIDRQLMGFHRQHQQAYRSGLAGVEQAAVALHGKRFGGLPAGKQDAVLAAMEKNKAPGEAWKKLPARQFFDLVISHTMQGYYGDPRHGGNRDAVSWQMLGVPLAPVRGRAKYDLSKGAV